MNAGCLFGTRRVQIFEVRGNCSGLKSSWSQVVRGHNCTNRLLFQFLFNDEFEFRLKNLFMGAVLIPVCVWGGTHSISITTVLTGHWIYDSILAERPNPDLVFFFIKTDVILILIPRDQFLLQCAGTESPRTTEGRWCTASKFGRDNR